MNTFQKMIKYAAMTIVVLLIFGILSGIVGLISSLVYIFDDKEEYKTNYSKDFSNVEELDINHGFGKLTIKSGDDFRVEGANVSKSFKAKLNDGTLYIEEVRKFLWFNFGSNHFKSSITVYVPDGFTARRIKINSGVGEVVLENLSTDQLDIDAGVGGIYGRNITAKSVKGNGGVGDIRFNDVNFSDVDFDSGVGSLKIDGIILGNSEFDCGVGSIKLDIRGRREDYTLRCDSGIGSIKVNGERITSEYRDNNSAPHSLSIIGGMGSVDIKFSN